MSDIATKLITVANNTPAVAEAVKAAQTTVSGATLAVDDVLDMEHPLQVQLHSDTMEDFSGVNVTRYGKNLLDFVGLLGEGYTNERNGLSCHIENGCAVITGTHTYTDYTNILQADRFNDEGRDPVIIFPAGTYTLPSGLTVQLNNTETGKNTNFGSTFTLTVPYRFVTFYSAYSGEGRVVDVTIPLVMVAGSEAPTEYIPYIEPQTATADASGKVEGLTSVSPSVTLLTDSEDVTVECTYFPQGSDTTCEKYIQLKREENSLQFHLKKIT